MCRERRRVGYREAARWVRRSLCYSWLFICLPPPPPSLFPLPLPRASVRARACGVHDPNFFWLCVLPVVFLLIIQSEARCLQLSQGRERGWGMGDEGEQPFGRMMYVALSIWSSRTSVWPATCAAVLAPTWSQTGLQVLTWPATKPTLLQVRSETMPLRLVPHSPQLLAAINLCLI